MTLYLDKSTHQQFAYDSYLYPNESTQKQLDCDLYYDNIKGNKIYHKLEL